ncbi:MAG: hypothetical protein HY719_00430 [Planctomycetes bacterium]|nr:hypothetical protein [Planctomycetota bacterium]
MVSSSGSSTTYPDVDTKGLASPVPEEVEPEGDVFEFKRPAAKPAGGGGEGASTASQKEAESPVADGFVLEFKRPAAAKSAPGVAEKKDAGGATPPKAQGDGGLPVDPAARMAALCDGLAAGAIIVSRSGTRRKVTAREGDEVSFVVTGGARDGEEGMLLIADLKAQCHGGAIREIIPAHP